MKATVCSLLALLVATPSLDAQLDLSWYGGVPGNGLVFELEGDAAQLYVLLISLDEGPTPLTLLDPSDPRLLGVGLDLLHLARSGLLLVPGMSASEVYPLPPASGLQGLPLYAQAMTMPGGQHFVDQVSKRSSFVLALPDSSHLTLSPQLCVCVLSYQWLDLLRTTLRAIVDHLETVEQRLGNIVQIIGGNDEEYLR